MLGTRHQRTFTVTEAELADGLYPELLKPPVLASAVALQWAELVAMTALGGCAVGCSFELTHVAPVGLGAAVEVTTWCVAAINRLHCWHAELHAVEPRRLLAYGRLSFKLVDLGRFVAQLERVAANQT